MAKGKEEKEQGGDTELNLTDVEETELQEEALEERGIAKVNLVTSDKKMTMSAPVKEFDDFKHSFKNMMTAFANFIEAAGLEIGPDETAAQMIILKSEYERLRKDVQAEEARMREESVSRGELEGFKADMEAEEARRREESVSRSELEELKVAASDKDAKLREDYVTRGEFEKFRSAVREVI